MEDSEKRRERLKAMRMEAVQAEVSDNVDSSEKPVCPSNPLIEPIAPLHVKENSLTVPRFDFYTDPMSAFSGNKRSMNNNRTSQHYSTPPMSTVSPMAQPSSPLSGGLRNPDMTPSPALQFQTNYSPDQRMYEVPLPYLGSGSWRSPIRMTSPFASNRGTPPGAWNRFGSTGCGFPSNSSRGGGSSSPGFGRGCGPGPNSGRGSGHRFSNSPSPSSGRGGRRGRGFRACFSARERPELFYCRSMVEDPWKMLKPVIRVYLCPWKA